jgi:hypothetical protein
VANQVLGMQALWVKSLTACGLHCCPSRSEQAGVVQVILGRADDPAGGFGNVVHSILHRLIKVFYIM